jgi:peptidyl-prolyl cis-trans isomerase C
MRLSRLWILLPCLWVLACSEGQVVATVDSSRITLEELEELSAVRADMLGLEALSLEQRKEVLDFMIEREVVYLHARNSGAEVPEEKVGKALEDFSFLDRLRYRERVEKNMVFEEKKKEFAGGSVSDADVRRYYEEHREEFTLPVRYKVYLVQVGEGEARHVLSKSRQHPEAFDDMALRTESAEIRQINEQAPYSSKEDFPEEMWPFLERMEVGDIEGPVAVKRGTFLFKLVDRKPPESTSLGDAHFEIQHTLLAKKGEKAFREWYEAVKDDYAIEVRLEVLFSGGGDQ